MFDFFQQIFIKPTPWSTANVYMYQFNIIQTYHKSKKIEFNDLKMCSSCICFLLFKNYKDVIEI